MCFTIDPRWQLQTATKDLKVFKMLTEGRVSPYQRFQYPPAGEKVVVTAVEWGRTVRRALGPDSSLYYGLHSNKQPKNQRWMKAVDRFDFNAVIPKGAQYFENEKEYLSNALIVNRKWRKPNVKRKKANASRARTQQRRKSAARKASRH